MIKRILIAHGAKEDQSEIDSVVKYVKKRIPGAEVATAREQWFLRLASSGSADQLAQDLGGGTNLDGSPLFHVVIFMRQYICKRSALTAQAALSRNRLVLFLDGLKVIPVRGVNCVDPDDWKAGWMLEETQ